MKLIKELLHQIHLWLGLISGIVILIVCLTGGILALEKDINGIFNSEVLTVTPQGDAHTVEDIKKSFETSHPKHNISSISIPNDLEKAYKISYVPEGHKGGRRGRLSEYVNPYTLESLGSENSSLKGFFMFNFKLHRWLLAGDIGKMIVGVSTIIFLVLCFTGLILWWPSKMKQLKQGLTVKWGASKKRVNYDMHNTWGFYVLIPSIIMCITGLCWSFSWYNDGVYLLFDGKLPSKEDNQPHKIDSENQYLSFQDKMDFVDTIYPEEGGYSISFPNKKQAVYTVSKAAGETFFSYGQSRKVTFNTDHQPNSHIAFEDYTLGRQMRIHAKSLHIGYYFGTFGRWIYCICSLIATTLPVTGFLVWWFKRNKKGKGKKKNKMQLA
ncbi:PepSY-associated TM helix domain-containing protein [Flammeovirga agarivorans]|uniref:PepSY domain-containing protein n=1 Tax=Flammeovirga agarivorans TaxID=2726742 RepID=A0A7X8SMN9_9BACT|nr:PepSY-associated TM helix domain-containing protein [Flammeovirga agarivorans]NLR93029.1 PepSY domain-containing protein [Flammeovirga agarivorans]